MPAISVIMGIYNTNNKTMVEAAVDSILQQTFKDFEFIICDDGSIDGTYDLIQQLAKKDDRIVIIKNEKNQGLAAALNHCLKISKGEYIARMDADDISLPTRLSEMLEFLVKKPQYAFVGCCAYLFNDKGIWGRRLLKEEPEKKDFLFGTPFIHPTIIIRKDVLVSVGGYRVSKETLRAEDYDLFMRLYAKDYTAYNLQKYLYEFREDNNTYKRRSFSYRLGETKVRLNGFRALKLMPVGYLYIVKPLIVGLIPQLLLKYLRKETGEIHNE